MTNITRQVKWDTSFSCGFRFVLLGLFIVLPANSIRASDDDDLQGIINLLEARSSTARLKKQLIEELAPYGPQAAPVVPILIESLGDDATDVRCVALQALTKIGKPGVPHLIGALEQDDPNIVIGVMKVLRELGAEAKAANPRLLRKLASDEGKVRAYAAQALGKIGEEASVPALTELLRSDPDIGVRRNVAWALANLGPKAKAAVPALIEAERLTVALANKDLSKLPDSGPRGRDYFFPTDHPEWSLSWAVCDALAAIGEPAVPALVELLEDQDKRLRSSGVITLGKMGGKAKAAVPALTKRLQDQEADVREWAADSLASIGPVATAAVPGLRKAFLDQEPWVRFAAARAMLSIDPEADGALEVLEEGLQDKEPKVRSAAVHALWLLRVPTRVTAKLLASGLKDEDATVREEVVRALGGTGRPAEVVIPALEIALEDRSRRVRETAIWCLVDLKDGASAVPALIRALTNADADIRQKAAMGLERQARYASAAVPALKQALEDPDKDVRRYAASALKQIKEAKEK